MRINIHSLIVAVLMTLFQVVAFADQHSFIFTLSKSGNTSGGVYDTSGNLVRTMWSNVPFLAGAHAQAWDGRDDDGRHVSSGNYTMRVRSSDVTYTWEGVIGNTSSASSGPTKHRYFQFINTMAIAGDYAYYGTHYNEGWTAHYKFALNNPQTKIPILFAPGTGQTTECVATDGTTVFWGGNDPYNQSTSFVFGTKTSDDTEVLFANGTSYKTTHGRTYPKCIAFQQVANSNITGLAVQKTGSYLFVARKALNQIQVVHKTTGALVQTLTHTAPGFLAVDGSDANLWIQSGTSINKYTVQSNGTLSASILTISGLSAPVGIAASPDNSTLLVADAGSSQQIKAFSNSTGASVWTHGTAGGYANDPTVSDSKFYFSDQTAAVDFPLLPFVCYQPDGTFWVGDAGNYRVQHYAANRTFIERVMVIPHSYSIAADPNAPTRVFNEYLEFAVDYTKPLAGNNGSWTLVRNWRGGVPNAFYQDFMVNILRSVTTMNNGRTYALLQHISSHRYQVVELPPTGSLRFTSIELGVFTNDRIEPDGSLRTYTNTGLGGTATWRSRPLTGFDASHNPVWAAANTLASITPVVGEDPHDWSHSSPSRVTSTNLVISFDPAKPAFGRSHGWHLGAVAVGGSAWKWRTAPSTGSNYLGPYPSDGGFDTGNYVQYPGGDVLVVDNNIFWSYHGEFWKNSQTNKWNHVYDDGLMVGQFGVTTPEMNGLEAAPGIAGNVFSVASVKDAAGNVYVYHNDESNHGGVHRWKISGLNTIQEQNFPVTITATPGLLGEFFSGTDLNNARLLRSAVDPTVNLTSAPAASFSARWNGFVEPVTSQTYTLYTNVPRGVRLWVDEQLVIDQWSAAVPAEYSAAVAMTAGRRYPIRLECFGATGAANVSLSWSSPSQSKVLIPSAQLLPAVAPDRSSGVNLLEGLAQDAILQDNLYGWRRTPAAEDLTDRGSKYWSVKSGHTTYGRFNNPDLYVLYRQTTGNYSVTRDLGALPAQVMSWKLDGGLNWNGNYENGAHGGSYIEVLDAAGKVIARFWVEAVWVSGLETNNVTIRANGQTMANGYSAVTEPVTRSRQPLSISAAANGQITVSYGPYAAITTSVFDPTSNWQSPQTLRLYYFTAPNGSSDRALSLDSLRFTANSGDTDNDGLTDAWELTHSLNPNSAADATLDSDGDGQTNIQEFRSGTDPRSRSSRLAAQVTPAAPAGQFSLSFDAIPGRSYTARYKNSLTDPTWQPLSQIPPSTSGTIRTVTDTPPPGTPRRFYQIVTPAQP